MAYAPNCGSEEKIGHSVGMTNQKTELEYPQSKQYGCATGKV